jgi:hypothetical protein
LGHAHDADVGLEDLEALPPPRREAAVLAVARVRRCVDAPHGQAGQARHAVRRAVDLPHVDVAEDGVFGPAAREPAGQRHGGTSKTFFFFCYALQ